MATNPLSHISIGVPNLASSQPFYTAVLAPLQLPLVYESHPSSTDPVSPTTPRTLGYGPDPDREVVNIFEYGTEAHPPGQGCHVAFFAPTRKAVDEFHAAALSHGGKCDGPPGLREHYGRNYYAAFVVDPDGWRLEAVCKASE